MVSLSPAFRWVVWTEESKGSPGKNPNIFESVFFRACGLKTSESYSPQRQCFVATSNKVTAMEMSPAIQKELDELNEGFLVYDSEKMRCFSDFELFWVQC